MPLNVNGYSQDFQRFVDFASGPVKAGDIAKMDGIRHTVSKSSSDSVGGFYSLFRSQGNKDANDVTRILFKQSVADIFGGEDKIPDSVKTAMKLEDFGQGKPLTARRIMAVKTAIDQHHYQSFIDRTVKGEGQAADFLRGLFDAKLGTEMAPEKKLAEDGKPLAMRWFNEALVRDCKKHSNGVWDTAFTKDLARGHICNVGGKQLPFRDLTTARNLVAQFVTKDDSATYEGLRDPKAKAKADFIMALFGQDTVKAADVGIAAGLDPNLKTSKFMVMSGGTNTYTYNVGFTGEGKLVLDMDVQHNDVPAIADTDTYRAMQLGPGSSINVKMHLEIDADEFDRMTSQDYGQVTDEMLRDIGEGQVDDAATSATGATASSFKLDLSKVDCQIQFTADLKPQVD